jgi:Arsenical resistance operon protein ArsD
MATVEVFDPAMCCSTGVCGPSVDPALVRFAADLEWLTAHGANVVRATLSQQPERFVATEPVRVALAEQGEKALPAVVVDGRLYATGRYPGRAELAWWAGLADPDTQTDTDQPSAGPAHAVVPATATQLPLSQLPLADSGCCGGGSC